MTFPETIWRLSPWRFSPVCILGWFATGDAPLVMTMVISDELKFPRVLPVDPFRKDRKVEEVDPVPAVARIGAFKREWNRQRGRDRERLARPRQLEPDRQAAVRRQIRWINDKFEQQGISLRLLLTRVEDGFHLDVYDCLGDTMCQVAGDLTVTLEDLPILLRNLEEEAGLLVDTRT